MLTFGGLGALTVLGAGSAVFADAEDTPLAVTMTPESHADPIPVHRTDLQTRTALGAATYVYEVDGQPTAFYATADFATRLERWFATHLKETGQRPDEVWSFGAWTPGAERSWHGSGEAFDVGRLRSGGKDLVSARYDRWRDDTQAEVRTRLRLYWQLAAGLHLEFADVVTYLYDSNHSNHIHVDTGRFGPNGTPRLIPRSEVQVQAIQAMCRHVWGRSDVEISGHLDTATRDATSKVIADHGGGHAIDDGVEGWRAFLLPTLRAA